MRTTILARALLWLVGLMTIMGLLPMVVCVVWPQDNPHGPFPWCMMLAMGLAVCGLLAWHGRSADLNNMLARECMAATVLFWILTSIIAGTGIWLAAEQPDHAPSWIASVFEGVSGLTTTGSSIFGGRIPCESLDSSLLLWRSLLQWVGGIGIVVFALTVLRLPNGPAAYHLFRSEVPGLTADRLAPRIADTSRILVKLYVGLTLLVMLGLILSGASVFAALNHAMTTVSTGGFSVYSTSVEGMESAAAEWVIIVGMALSGLNFGLIYQVFLGRPMHLVRNPESRWFLGLLLGAAMLCILLVSVQGAYENIHDVIRDCIFQVVSLATSTGFVTAYDVEGLGGMAWEAWPSPAIGLLFMLMISGGCAGSTAGGVKVIRVLAIMRTIQRLLIRHVEPSRIKPVRIGSTSLSNELMVQVLGFAVLWMAVWCMGSFVLLAMGVDAVSAGTAVVSCLSNIGPGLNKVGPSQAWLGLGDGPLLICSIIMLIGRLEIFVVLVVLSPNSWRR